jgi:hypothetical protein
MRSKRIPWFASFIFPLLLSWPAQAQQAANPPLPEVHQLMREVEDHQKQFEKIRENYAFNIATTTEDLDGKGQVVKTESRELEASFVNGREIQRLVKKDGKPLSNEEQQKENERVNKEVENAEHPAPVQKNKGQNLNLTTVLENVEVRNPRRENYHGRPTLVFDFMGRKDLKAHGMAEDLSKKIQGTVWIDEADRVVAHLDVSLFENFRVAGGLLANIEKGTSLHFEQNPINSEIWFQTGVDGSVQMRLFLVKGLHQHFSERDHDFKKFHVDSEQGKTAKLAVEVK